MSEKDHIISQPLHQYIKTEIGKNDLSKRNRNNTYNNIKLKSFINQYDKGHKMNNKNFIKLKETTEQFHSSYLSIVGKRNKSHYIENIFHDLILKYKHKEYNIPDLTTKNNLFEPNPLLLENNKINEYYQLQKFQQSQMKYNKNKHLKTNNRNTNGYKAIEKSKVYLCKLNKSIVNQKRKKEKSKALLSKSISLFESLKSRNIEDKKNKTNSDTFTQENTQLKNDIEILTNNVNTLQQELNSASLMNSNKNNINVNNNSNQIEDSMIHIYSTFNSTGYTALGPETKPCKAISTINAHYNKNTTTPHSSKTISKKVKMPLNVINCHSRNNPLNLNLPIPYNTVNELILKPNPQFDFTLSQKDFLNHISSFNFSQLSLSQFEEMIREYFTHYSDINDDIVKKYILNKTNPRSLLMNINRFQEKLKKYNITANYPLKNNKDINQLNTVGILDSKVMRLDKLLGKKIIKVDYNSE